MIPNVTETMFIYTNMLYKHRKCLEESKYETVIVIFGDWWVAKDMEDNSFLFIASVQLFFFLLFMATSVTHGISWARGRIRTTAAGLYATATATQDPTSSWRLCQVLNPMSHNGKSFFFFLYKKVLFTIVFSFKLHPPACESSQASNQYHGRNLSYSSDNTRSFTL